MKMSEFRLAWVNYEVSIMIKGAILSDDRQYRYSLWRIWDETKEPVVFIGLNPSTADESEDDSTIRRCIDFAESWGYGGIYMLNLFAYRTKEPKIMKSMDDPVGPDFLKYFAAHVSLVSTVVVAWGNHGEFQDRANEVLDLIMDNYNVRCFGLNKNKTPKHPLYLKGTTPLMKYDPTESEPDASSIRLLA